VKFSVRKVGRLMTVGAVATLGVAVLNSGIAAAATTNGPATLNGTGTGNPLLTSSANPSTTPFLVEIPGTPVCSGTGSQGYNVVSYILPKADAFTTATPAYYIASGNDYGPTATAPSSSQYGFQLQNGALTFDGPVPAGGTGSLPSPVPDQMGPSNTASILGLSASNPTVVEEVGRTCVDGTNKVTDWWNVEITFTYAPNDTNGFTWSQASTQTPEVSTAIALPVGGLTVIGGGLFLNRRRNRRRATASA
jgi:hypothetical protein